MKKLFRISAAITLAVFIFTGALAVNAYEPSQEVMVTLGSLDIIKGYEDGSYRFENEVTRAEFSAVVARLLGVQNIIADTGVSAFDDVAPSHWAYNNISIMTRMQIIEGFGDGTFRPEDPVLYEQAVKMVVAALGYDIAAESKGGYPMGYLTVAAERGVTRNVAGEASAPIIRGAVMQLVYNALDVDMMVKTGTGENEKHTIEPGKTLRTERLKQLGREQSYGQVTANEITALNRSYGTGEGQVEIDGQIYLVGETDAAALLGRKVVFYAEEEGGRMVLLHIEKDRNYNEEIIVQAEDIRSLDGSGLVYWADTQKSLSKKVSFENREDMSLIYNGKAVVPFEEHYLDIGEGSMLLLDSDKNGRADVVFINTYSTHIIQNVDVSRGRIELLNYSHKIYTGYMGSYSIDFSDSAIKKSIYDMGGAAISLSDLKRWDVISVLGSGEHMEITVTNKRAMGTIQEIDHQKGNIIIDDQQYSVAKSASGELLPDDIGIGKTGVFLLDIEGRVFYAAISESDQEIPGRNFGYLLNVFAGEGLNKTSEFKFLVKTADGGQETRVFYGAEYITFNGVRTKNDEVMRRIGSELQKTFRIETDALGNISLIESVDTIFTGEMRKYFSANRSFDNIVFLEEGKTVLFYADILGITEYEREKVDLVNGRNYYIEVYEMPAEGIYEDDERIIVIKTEMATPVRSELDKNTAVIVDGVYESIDEYGEITYRLTGTSGDEEISRLFAVNDAVRAELSG